MTNLFRYFKNESKDGYHNYHKYGCTLAGWKFTVLRNFACQKLYEGQVKYCPCCGAKLKKW